MRKLEIRNDDKPNVLLAAVAEMTRLCQRSPKCSTEVKVSPGSNRSAHISSEMRVTS
ncbi:Uncharacterised protein [Salmonella enterica subsp. enterica serovar Bovismorbificans]|uniref:Uncharacterized protein n=1 Tax=Salmonella enterica subsp. enterica serovar Bovismorbificans TaxID=58097 RepID=A0A655DAJ8_SALET|nr:Uncharacterised protein [Salmonella enterica subsp. enterica serovar Bovismorbificans]CNU58115.1 Uncharacterised protein [Salmonella enterica subsp. enterica serovar Bovismorbificans]